MSTTTEIKKLMILALLQDTCPITADVAAFPGTNDAKTVRKAHDLVRQARRFYIAGATMPKKGMRLRTAVHYREHHPDDYGGLSSPAWLAEQLAQSSSNPEVLIVAPEQALPYVYMAVLKELIEHFDVRQFRNYEKLPKIIPCISGARTARGLKFEGTTVSIKQLEAYFKAKGLGKT